MRLVQLVHPQLGRRVAIVEEPNLVLLFHPRTIHALALLAIGTRKKLSALAAELRSPDTLPYDPIYTAQSDWQLLAPYDHPDPAHLFITGTGLTHKKSADSRQSMHSATAPVSDSMKMYEIGLAGGRPAPGQIGAAPEWFYKGTGAILRAPNAPLEVPAHGHDGGEEAEIAGLYFIADDFTVYRLGLVQSNEFSDHVLESQNYLYLAPSKLRQCSIGPELVLDYDFANVPGKATIYRDGQAVWSAPQLSGQDHMSHTLANLEHHHFKHAAHRTPGDAHLHFFGADHFSYKDQLALENGDVMEIAFQHFGRPLRNPIHLTRTPQPLVTVKSL